MPLLSKPGRTKKIAFFYGMVTGEFVSYRTYDSDMQTQQLALALRSNEPEDYPVDDFIAAYAECVTYTESLEFNWHEDTPPDVRALETFWQMVVRGEAPIACFAYFKSHVATNTILARRKSLKAGMAGWSEAKREALKIWEPPTEWKLEDELEEHEKADPLS